MLLRCSYSRLLHRAVAVKQEISRGSPSTSIRGGRTAFFPAATAVDDRSKTNSEAEVQNYEKPVVVTTARRGESLTTAYSAPSIDLGRSQTLLRPSPELGLVSLLFVLSMAFGAIISLAIISIPTVRAFKRLGVSTHKLVQLVSQEVPSTMSSLRLSAFEINDLTEQLNNLTGKIYSGRNQRAEDREP